MSVCLCKRAPWAGMFVYTHRCAVCMCVTTGVPCVLVRVCGGCLSAVYRVRTCVLRTWRGRRGARVCAECSGRSLTCGPRAQLGHSAAAGEGGRGVLAQKRAYSTQVPSGRDAAVPGAVLRQDEEKQSSRQLAPAPGRQCRERGRRRHEVCGPVVQLARGPAGGSPEAHSPCGGGGHPAP